MYPVSDAFLSVVQENTRRYHWTGRITTEKIVNFFDGKLEKDVTMCTDSHKSYASGYKELDIKMRQIPRGRRMD